MTPGARRTASTTMLFGLAGSLLAATLLSQAQSRVASGSFADARDAIADATADAADVVIDDAPPAPTAPRPTVRPPRGAFHPLDDASPLRGIVWAPSREDPTRGRVVVLWAARSHPALPRGGEYTIEGDTVHVRDTRGAEATFTIESSRGELRVRIGSVDERLRHASSLCDRASDCALQIDSLPAFSCGQAVQWSCGRETHECRAHCGSPARTPPHHRCGPAWCPVGEVCCNSVNGACVPPGYGCGQ